MSHVVKTIKIKRGAKMHILANGAGRNLRSTIMNHLKIRIMDRENVFKFYNKTAASVFDLDNIVSALEKGKTDTDIRMLKNRTDILRELCNNFRVVCGF